MTDEPAPGGREHSAADLVGATVADRYRVERVVSEGANTVIFDAEDTTNGRRVTLKVLQPTLAVSAEFAERFERSVRAVSELSHPNIAAIYDWGRAAFLGSTTLFVVQQRLASGSLRDLFDRGRRLTPSQALVVGLDACRALDFAHRRGFVHGELNPSKLVFGEDRRLRIVDIGLASLLGEEQWREPATVATHVARYASPEQALSLPIDGKTDVYALCLTLSEAVTGSLPFAADSTVATLSARVGRLMPVSADLGPLAAVLSHAGRPDPEDRSTAAEFGRELLAAASKLPRPEPLPLLSTALFETPIEDLRSPEDPTGGVTRPPAGDDALVLVPLDEPDAEHDAEPDDEPALPPPPPPGEGLRIVEDEVDAPLAPPPLVAPIATPLVPPAAQELPTEQPPTEQVPMEQPPTEQPPTEQVPTEQPPTEQPPTEQPPTEQPPMEQLPADEPRTEALAGEDGAPVPSPDASPVDGRDHEPRRRRRVPWKLIVPVLVVLALAGLGVAAWRLFSTPSYEVPDLVGLDEAVALNEIAGNGWEVTTETERSDEEPDAGQVIRTIPAAGVDLAEGEPILLVVSEGPTLRTLPELNGLSFADAQTAVVELGLVVVPVEQYDEVVLPGQVITWSVPSQPTLVAGAQVLPGTEVQIVSSLGPAPRTVPDLANLTVADAQNVVAPLALALAEGEQVFSDTVPAGAIVSQAPLPNEQVPKGATITVQVSKGPDVVTLPDLTGQTYDQAAATLQAAGFVPTLVFGASDGVFVSATVAGQPVSAGQVFPRGTTVELTHL